MTTYEYYKKEAIDLMWKGVALFLLLMTGSIILNVIVFVLGIK